MRRIRESKPSDGLAWRNPQADKAGLRKRFGRQTGRPGRCEELADKAVVMRVVSRQREARRLSSSELWLSAVRRMRMTTGRRMAAMRGATATRATARVVIAMRLVVQPLSQRCQQAELNQQQREERLAKTRNHKGTQNQTGPKFPPTRGIAVRPRVILTKCNSMSRARST